VVGERADIAWFNRPRNRYRRENVGAVRCQPQEWAAVKNLMGIRWGAMPRRLSFTSQANAAISFASEEAKELQSDLIGAEHLLLGILREPYCMAGRVLGQLGVDGSEVRLSLIGDLEGAKVSESSGGDDEFDDDDGSHRAADRWGAKYFLSCAYSFLNADAVKPEMLEWLDDNDEILGLYMNEENDYFVLCENGLHWYANETQKYIAYNSLVSVELPRGEDDRFLKLVLRPYDEVVLLPVLHETEGSADMYYLYDFLTLSMITPILKMEVREIETKEDLVYFLRQPNVTNTAVAELATWLEQGAPKHSWLDALEIDAKVVQNPSALRLIALLVLRFPSFATATD
jgi:hypothetical protein